MLYKLTCNIVRKVPAIVMMDGLEILYELLDHGLYHHPIVILGLRVQHHLAPPVRAKLL